MAGKQRLTITVDPQLLAAAQQAVADGSADSVSAWVNMAIDEKVNRDAKLANLAQAVANFEAEHGEISTEEMAAQRRTDRASATVVRGAASA